MDAWAYSPVIFAISSELVTVALFKTCGSYIPSCSIGEVVSVIGVSGVDVRSGC